MKRGFRSNFLVLIILILLIVIPVSRGQSDSEYHREVEVGAYDDYVEILTYNYTETNQSSHDTELEISISTEGKEGPIIITFDYESEVSGGGSSTETALSYTLVFDRLIEYHDDNANGVYDPGSDSQI